MADLEQKLLPNLTAAGACFTVIGLWCLGLFDRLNWVLRNYLLEAWVSLACGLGLWLLGVVALVYFSRSSKTRGEVYLKRVKSLPSGALAAVTVGRTPGRMLAVAGGATMALGLKMLALRAFEGESLTWQASSAAWATVGLGLLIATFRSSETLDAAGKRLIRKTSLLGLSYTRRTEFSSDVKVRVREQITPAADYSFLSNALRFTSWEASHQQDRCETAAPPLRDNHRHQRLELVDRGKIYPLSTSEVFAAAGHFAGHFQHHEYEHLICDGTSRNRPHDAVLLDQPPVERVVSGASLLAVMVAAFVILVPMGYQRALQNERAGVSRTRDDLLQRSLMIQSSHDLERKHSNTQGPLAPSARKDYETALVNWEALLGKEPDNPEFLLSRGRLRLRLARTKEGLADVERFRHLEPGIWRAQGAVHHNVYELPVDLLVQAYMKVGEYKRALEILDYHKQEGSSPGHGAYDPNLALRGLVLVDMGRRDEAQRVLRSVNRGSVRDEATIAELEKRLSEHK